MQDLHHSDIITYALTRLAGQYAREKQEILRDLKNYRASDAPVPVRIGGQETSARPSSITSTSTGQFSMPPRSRK